MTAAKGKHWLALIVALLAAASVVALGTFGAVRPT